MVSHLDEYSQDHEEKSTHLTSEKINLTLNSHLVNH